MVNLGVACVALVAAALLVPVPATAVGEGQIEARYASSTGWVEPGADFPVRIRYRITTASSMASIHLVFPPSGFVVSSEPAPTTQAANEATFDLGAVPAGTSGEIVVRARAATLGQDPEVIWKDLSAEATLDAGGTSTSSRTLGPRVATLASARFGVRPFPMLNVQYQDVRHCSGAGEPYPECLVDHSSDLLDKAVNSRASGTSVWQLYNDMSLGQLQPQGTVPTVGVDNAPFEPEQPHRWSALQPQGACTGVTIAGTEGTAAYSNRVEGGWYTLPGTQGYYGADRTGHGLVGGLTEVGLLFGIDDACGPPGKLVYDAASIADPDMDYNEFDPDRDGLVDFMMVLYAGDFGIGASPTALNNVWPHSSDLQYYFTDANGEKGYVSNDQLRDAYERPLWWTSSERTGRTTQDMGAALKAYVRVGPYNVNPEASMDRISVIAHEYGHSLGLPDFYSLGARGTFGTWELMAIDHAQFMTAMSRQKLGWVVPRDVGDGVYALTESKNDTHSIVWRRPDGTPYTLSGPHVHNADVLRFTEPNPPVIESPPSGAHAWYSGSGDDFGCPPQQGRGLLVRIPESAQHGGSKLTLTMKSLYEIEWDFDYGFMLASADGGQTWKSLPSARGTTISDYNPNASPCQIALNNGITGVSGQPNTPTNPDRVFGTYAAPAWIDDEFDLTAFSGTNELWVMFAYATDPGVKKRGWFIDDVKVTATSGEDETVLYSSDFEDSHEPTRLFPAAGGGWARMSSDVLRTEQHAFFVELRDRVGWDFDGRDQSDLGPTTWEPGIAITYSNELRGYGNTMGTNPPVHTIVDSVPQPGNDSPNLDDAAFTRDPARSLFDSCTHVENYSDPSNTEGSWRLPKGFRLHVAELRGLSPGATVPSAATATVAVDVRPSCTSPAPVAPHVSFAPGHVSPDTDGDFAVVAPLPAGAVSVQIQEGRNVATLFADGAEGTLDNWVVRTNGTLAREWSTSPLRRSSGERAFWVNAVDGSTDAESILEVKHGIQIPVDGRTQLRFFDALTGEGDDIAAVEASTGSEWVPLSVKNATTMVDNAAPVDALTLSTVDLTGFAGEAIKIRFRFAVGPENRLVSSPIFGWYVDDIQITTEDWTTIGETIGAAYLVTNRVNGTYLYRARVLYPFGSAATMPGPFSEMISTAVDIPAFAVAAVSPPDAATGVPLSSVLTATFNRTVSASSISLTLSDGRRSVVGKVSCNSPCTTVTFDPKSKLKRLTTYTAVAGASTTDGNVSRTWSFTTAGQ